MTNDNLSSQFLAILYLSKLQHYITNNLHIKFINYMDDYILFHNSKEYLKDSLELIENKIYKEYKLKLNNKKNLLVVYKEKYKNGDKESNLII